MSPTSNRLALFTKLGNGNCASNGGKRYSSITSVVGLLTNTEEDAEVCSAYCSQNGNHLIANFVGLEITNADAANTKRQCDCLFSGGLPSPIPSYVPDIAGTYIADGTGPIASIFPKSNYRCYVFKSATFAPSPSPTASPSTSPTEAPVSTAPVTVAPTTNAPTTKSPTACASGYDCLLPDPDCIPFGFSHCVDGCCANLPTVAPSPAPTRTICASGHFCLNPDPDCTSVGFSHCLDGCCVNLPSILPSTSPSVAPSTPSPVSMAPVTQPPVSIDGLQLVGQGYCADANGDSFSKIVTELPATSTASSCNAWCMQNETPDLVGMVVEQKATSTTCECLFDNNVPSPVPVYNPPAILWVDAPGLSPIFQAIVTTGNPVCWEYIINDSTTQSPVTPSPVSRAPATPHPVASKSSKVSKSAKNTASPTGRSAKSAKGF